MMKFKFFLLQTIVCSSLAFAGDMGDKSDTPIKLFFLGLGGSYNSVKLDQYFNPLIGTTNIYNGGTLVAFGTANGPAVPFHTTQTTFAPEAQLGYLQSFANQDWLWGIKLAYNYLSITMTDSDLVSPQLGTLTPVTGEGTGFTGRATISSVQTRIEHEFDLMAMIQHSFKNINGYLGLGPTIFGTRTNIYNVTGFADIDGTHADVSGTPVNFASTKWVWGGVVSLGMTYIFNPTWFLDINYRYAISPYNKTDYTSPFAGTLANGYTKTGTLFGTTNQYITVQGISLTINKTFDFV